MYTKTSGQASVSLIRTEGGTIKASAACDSLTLLVEDLKTEIYHLNNEKISLKSKLNKKTVLEVSRLTPWQAFQVWTGRIALVGLALWLIIKRFKIKQLWQ